MIKAILFDMDGVLVDAKEYHYQALNMALEKYGFSPISRLDHLSKYDALPTRSKLKLYSQTNFIPDDKKELIFEKKQDFFYNIIQKSCVPDINHISLMETLKKREITIGVCSNSVKASIEYLLNKTKLLSYVDFIFSNEDVTHPKPNPEMYLMAIKKTNLNPNEVLICEDSVKGLEAAKLSQAHVLQIDSLPDLNLTNIENAINKIQSSSEQQTLVRSPIRQVRLKEMTGGWFVGNFLPSILKTSQFEVGFKTYKAGDTEKWHVHRKATEITLILNGEAIMGDKHLKHGDIILLEPHHGTSFKALTNVDTVVVKTPSAIGDKYFE